MCKFNSGRQSKCRIRTLDCLAIRKVAIEDCRVQTKKSYVSLYALPSAILVLMLILAESHVDIAPYIHVCFISLPSLSFGSRVLRNRVRQELKIELTYLPSQRNTPWLCFLHSPGSPVCCYSPFQVPISQVCLTILVSYSTPSAMRYNDKIFSRSRFMERFGSGRGIPDGAELRRFDRLSLRWASPTLRLQPLLSTSTQTSTISENKLTAWTTTSPMLLTSRAPPGCLMPREHRPCP